MRYYTRYPHSKQSICVCACIHTEIPSDYNDSLSIYLSLNWFIRVIKTRFVFISIVKILEIKFLYLSSIFLFLFIKDFHKIILDVHMCVCVKVFQYKFYIIVIIFWYSFTEKSAYLRSMFAFDISKIYINVHRYII